MWTLYYFCTLNPPQTNGLCHQFLSFAPPTMGLIVATIQMQVTLTSLFTICSYFIIVFCWIKRERGFRVPPTQISLILFNFFIYLFMYIKNYWSSAVENLFRTTVRFRWWSRSSQILWKNVSQVINPFRTCSRAYLLRVPKFNAKRE